jgi:arylsulfatase A-like enzyme
MSGISRRHLLQTVGLSPLLWCGGKIAAAAPQKPNIILLLADDLRFDALGVAGNRDIMTPNMDRLAKSSHYFSQSFVTTSICCTSRASIMLGEYANRHNIWRFHQAMKHDQLQRIYPVLLRKAGYNTCFIGKWGVGLTQHIAPLFNVWKGFDGNGDYYDEAHPSENLTERQSADAIRFIREAPANDPFLLVVCFKAPHNPLQPAPPFIEMYKNKVFSRPPNDSVAAYNQLPSLLKDAMERYKYLSALSNNEMFQNKKRGYYALVSELDAAVGNILTALDSLKARHNTWVILASDNGLMAGEHGLYGKGAMFEESIRVPLMIRPPGPLPKMLTHDALALNVDLAPTILDMAGLAPPGNMQGKSLLPLLGATPDWRKEFYYEYYVPWAPNGLHYGACRGIRSHEWKYSLYFAEKEEELLFHLAKDPYELVNLAALPQHASRLEELRARTKQMKAGLV